jgi:choline kinase
VITTAVVLAAGQGTRLRPLTDDRPKCMVELHGRPLLEWQLSALRAAGVEKIVVVRGYAAERIAYPGVTYLDSARFMTTNMVRTLLCARAHFADGFVLAYSDIVYEAAAVERLLHTSAEQAAIVDSDWLDYWSARFANPLDDAETLKLSGSSITEIGRKPETLGQIEAQFVGLVAFQGRGVERLLELTDLAEARQQQGGTLPNCPRNLDQLYTTDLLQGLIDRGADLRAEPIAGGWLEIDSVADLALSARCSRPEGERLHIDRRGRDSARGAGGAGS